MKISLITYDMKKSTHGFTLIEMLIYVGIVVLVLIFVVTGLLKLTSAYVKARNMRNVNEVGAQAMERIAREVRKATSIPTASGSTLTMNVPMTYAELVRYGSNGSDGAASHWDFEETSGTVLNDKISGKNGTLNNFPTTGFSSSALVGKGYSFDGSNDYIQIPIPTGAFNTYTQGAIEIIYRPTPSATLRSLFSTAKPSYIFAVKAWNVFADTHQINFWRNGSNVPTQTLNNTTFHHVVVQSAGGTDRSIYLDGVKVFYGVGAGSGWFSVFTDGVYHIGANDTGVACCSEYFGGIIDEVAVYAAPHDDTFWLNRYNTAFGVSSVNKTVTVTSASNQITIQDVAPSAEALTSTKATVTNLTFQEITGPVGGSSKRLGARISVTVTSGTGSTAVTRTFTTAAMMRNPK